jgi:hypothetical protein
MFSSNGQTNDDVVPLAGPDDQSGRVQNLYRAFCAKNLLSAFFDFKRVVTKN